MAEILFDFNQEEQEARLKATREIPGDKSKKDSIFFHLTTEKPDFHGNEKPGVTQFELPFEKASEIADAISKENVSYEYTSGDARKAIRFQRDKSGTKVEIEVRTHPVSIDSIALDNDQTENLLNALRL